ncbi:hypothetical protein Tco_1118151, partial [Tanacetum coccineum]
AVEEAKDGSKKKAKAEPHPLSTTYNSWKRFPCRVKGSHVATNVVGLSVVPQSTSVSCRSQKLHVPVNVSPDRRSIRHSSSVPCDDQGLQVPRLQNVGVSVPPKRRCLRQSTSASPHDQHFLTLGIPHGIILGNRPNSAIDVATNVVGPSPRLQNSGVSVPSKRRCVSQPTSASSHDQQFLMPGIPYGQTLCPNVPVVFVPERQKFKKWRHQFKEDADVDWSRKRKMDSECEGQHYQEDNFERAKATIKVEDEKWRKLTPVITTYLLVSLPFDPLARLTLIDFSRLSAITFFIPFDVLICEKKMRNIQ